MKPSRFKYYDADSVDEVVSLLAEYGDEAKVLAGGQSLMPMMNLRLAYPEVLIDVNRVSALDYTDFSDAGIEFGAIVRQAAIEHSDDVRRACPLLSEAMTYVAHGAIRNRGTIGGSLAHADPAAELPALAMALDATIVAVGPEGRREIPVEDFFAMPLVTTLASDELLTAVRIGVQPQTAGSAVAQIARRRGDFALAGVMATATVEDDRIAYLRLVAFATGPTPLRLRAAERALIGEAPSEEAFARAGREASEEISPSDDIHATAEYRRRVTATLVERALRRAIEESQGKVRS